MQRNKKRKRSLGRTLLTVYVVVAATIFFCGCNLYHYAFYYATHMPHAKNEYPVVREISHLLPNTVNQKYHSSINANEGTRDEFAAGYIRAYNVFQKGDLWTMDVSGAEYYPFADGEDFVGIDFDKNYKAGKIYAYLATSNPKSEHKWLYAPLKDFSQRLKEESPKPIINLQWLYNLSVKFRPNTRVY
jgi:hypothetical protein